MRVAIRLLVAMLVVFHCGHAAAADSPTTGPETEKRFPPLVMPAGFQATLFACDPSIEYPSGIAAGPKAGTAFVAIDYMTGLGTEIVRRSEVRFVQDTDGDGYADIAPVFAGEFNSIEGITWHDGVVYVMHAPFLTAVYDRDRDGRAEERRDLLTGLGLTPEDNPVRLHCANGIVMGHDGWLYLALGDHGCDVKRPEGDRLVFNGGGILRCRPDGRDLHVFASGLRNIYDVALDAELNVFVRDNENDGGDYKIRVCHSFFGADHGYPYNYYERPDEALPPLADLGLGSSAGGVCYLESQFPAEYRGNLFFCEWGKSLVCYRPERDKSSTFAPLKEIEFATGAASDPYGFKPTDVVVQRDGSLLVSDYCDGQRPKRGRGRVYCIRYVGDAEETQLASDISDANPSELLKLLNSESYYARWGAQSALVARGDAAIGPLMEGLLRGETLTELGRLHAVWAIEQIPHPKRIEHLLRAAHANEAPAVRVQAIRALADALDPGLSRDPLDAEAAKLNVTRHVAAFASKGDRRVLLEIIVALGRWRWAGTADWLHEHVQEYDPPLAHAAMMALRRSANWPAVLKLLDVPSTDPLRPIALRAAAEQIDPALVDGLIERLKSEQDAARGLQYADLLSRVHRLPGPWVYWNYRPAPRPANTETWERTQAIAEALDEAIGRAEPDARLALLQRMQREKIPLRLETLEWWLGKEPNAQTVEVLLASMTELPAGEARQLLLKIVLGPENGSENRLSALRLIETGLDEASAESVLVLGSSIEDESILAAALRIIGKYPQLPSDPVLHHHLSSPKPQVRAAAVEALANVRPDSDRRYLERLLVDESAAVRRAAAAAAGKLKAAEVADQLLRGGSDPDAGVRRASLDSLRQLREQRVVPLAVKALQDPQVSLTALDCLADLAGPEQAEAVAAVARQSPAADLQAAAIRVLATWRQRTATTPAQRQKLDQDIAAIQGSSGLLAHWAVAGPFPANLDHVDTYASNRGAWRTLEAAGVDARAVLAPADSPPNVMWLAVTNVAVPDAAEVQFLGSSSGSFHVFLNDKQIYERKDSQAFRADSDRFAATLAPGENRIHVTVGSTKEPVEFHLRFRPKSATAEHERLAQAAISRTGNIERGRLVLLSVEKSQCLKCHRVGDQGERTGPELTGLGSRFSRIHIAESILEPSRSIAPSFGTLAVVLTDGRPLSGVKIAETDATLTLVDHQAQKHVISKVDIDQQRPSTQSTMPEGLEKRLSEEEFVDLVALLASLKE